MNETSSEWDVETESGEIHRADVVLIAAGQLNQPSVPPLPGLDRFAGHSFHSARWDHDYELRGKRVAVIGNGASAVQFVPQIAGGVHYTESLTLAIRHPRSVGRVLALRSAMFMRRQLPDGELHARVWPDYPFGCKRVLFSSHYLPTLALPNVELVTDAITKVTDDRGHTRPADERQPDAHPGSHQQRAGKDQPAGHAVGELTRGQGEHEQRHELGQPDSPQVKRRAVLGIDLPADRHVEHLQADAHPQERQPPQTVVAHLQGRAEPSHADSA